MRGKGPCSNVDAEHQRITPAYAGKSPNNSLDVIGAQDHPRVCGEKGLVMVQHRAVRGSPPRMRGKESSLRKNADHHGITPAYAGKSFKDFIDSISNGDHPRVCGEKTKKIP